MSDYAAQLRKFVNNRISIAEFEQWIYDRPRLEGLLGSDLYLEAISLDYSNDGMVSEFRDKLCFWLDTNYPRECDCITREDDEQIPLGFEMPPDAFFSNFKVLKQRTAWLDLVQCLICDSYWYVATDTVEDNYHLLRLAAEDVRRILEYDDWPDRFNGLDSVWP